MSNAILQVNETFPRWVQTIGGGKQVLIRPINPDDASAERAFIQSLSSEAKRYRFMGQFGAPTDAMIERLTHIDYRNEVALVAVIRVDGVDRIIGVSRYHVDQPVASSPIASGAMVAAKANRNSLRSCECAVIVADAWQHKGVGTALMKHLIDIAKSAGLQQMNSVDFAENLAMRDLALDLGFHVRVDPEDAQQVIYELDLTQ
jgi:GNAT superfamily N-acetyltransferase